MNGNAWRKARKRAGLPEVRVHDIKQVVGSAATLDALRWGEVNILVMANDYQPDPGWTCTVCQSIGTETPETLVCPHCGHESVRPLDIREALLRLAGQSECPVEVVEQSDALMSLGGVGCLLRTCLAAKIDTQTATASG